MSVRFVIPMVLLAALLVTATTVSAIPYIPDDDQQILASASFRTADPATRELRALRSHLRAHPDDLEAAIDLAKGYIQRNRAEGEPRYLGYAQSVLAPWSSSTLPPTPVLLLQATINQSLHHFDRALADLDDVLARDPKNAQAWLTKASLLRVQGKYAEARTHCQPLARLAGPLVSLTCLSDIASLTGHAGRSHEVLMRSLDWPVASLRERLWLLVVLAESAARTGDAAMAERHFREALQLDLRDQYLIGAYADFLLDPGRAAEVEQWLRRETNSDGLLLRLALAEQARSLPIAQEHVGTLRARFAAGRQRGDTIHLREEARFTLALLHDAHAALKLAQANWEVQREPADARILLESALAAGRPAAAQPVLDWLKQSGIEDRQLLGLAKQIERRSS